MPQPGDFGRAGNGGGLYESIFVDQYRLVWEAFSRGPRQWNPFFLGAKKIIVKTRSNVGRFPAVSERNKMPASA